MKHLKKSRQKLTVNMKTMIPDEIYTVTSGMNDALIANRKYKPPQEPLHAYWYDVGCQMAGVTGWSKKKGNSYLWQNTLKERIGLKLKAFIANVKCALSKEINIKLIKKRLNL